MKHFNFQFFQWKCIPLYPNPLLFANEAKHLVREQFFPPFFFLKFTHD